jgi:putative tryptophan/tyrosine transport system ATP-binding protein
MITLEDINMVFNPGTADENNALKNINLKINKGDFITVIGSNGAGKSTLYNVIAGTLYPSSGRIMLDMADLEKKTNNRLQRKADGAHNGKFAAHDITRDKEYVRAQYIGRIFQNPLLGTAGNMSLQDNMMICCRKGWKGLRISLNGKMRMYFRQQLSGLEMGLENRLSDNVNQFSGGQRQALTLLMAVMSKPSLLLLDEHTAALDPTNATVVMNMTRRLAEEYGLTVMMVTHNMQQALDYGNRLLMMDAGEIILDVPAAEKVKLTMNDIVERFRAIKRHDLTNDQMILQ